jgi:hypothetical protein
MFIRRTQLFALALLMLGLASQPVSAQTTWRERYQEARTTLLRDQFAEAAREFNALEATAPTREDRALAIELASLARAELARRTLFAQPALRTNDELTVLYTTAVFYGLGTSAWLALQLKPQSFGGAIVPFALLTPASVALVAWADNYRPLRHGVPHALAAGMYLGFGEGLWIVGYQSAYAAHHTHVPSWKSERISTALWISSSVGALAGAAVGVLREPTPGRVSFTASTSIWAGLITAFATSAIESDRDARSQHAYLLGAIGYNAGLVTGLLLGPTVAPSVARVRFTDLGGLFGGLLTGGTYALVSRNRDSHVTLGLAAIGGVLGLGLTWWATSGMPPERGSEMLAPGSARRENTLACIQPLLTPLRGGFLAGVRGEL